MAVGGLECNEALTDAMMLEAEDEAAIRLAGGNPEQPAPLIERLQEIAMFDGNGNRVWGSHDCFPEDSSDTRTLAPGESVAFPLVWGGLTSEPSCTAARTTPAPGQYALRGRLDTKVSADAPFMLSAGHVLKASKDAAIMPAPMMPGSRMIPMPGVRINFTAEQKQVDVGFIRLTDEVASELSYAFTGGPPRRSVGRSAALPRRTPPPARPP